MADSCIHVLSEAAPARGSAFVLKFTDGFGARRCETGVVSWRGLKDSIYDGDVVRLRGAHAAPVGKLRLAVDYCHGPARCYGFIAAALRYRRQPSAPLRGKPD